MDIVVQEKLELMFQPFVEKVRNSFEDVQDRLRETESKVTDFNIDLLNRIDEMTLEMNQKIKKLK